MKFGYRKPSMKKRIAARTSWKRAVRAKYRAPKGYGWITNPKKAMYNRVYYRTTKKACYIATAVYGHEDMWQVEKLRQFRDRTLRQYWLGRLFIIGYYKFSPRFIILFKDVKMINSVTRKMLDWFVGKI